MSDQPPNPELHPQPAPYAGAGDKGMLAPPSDIWPSFAPGDPRDHRHAPWHGSPHRRWKKRRRSPLALFIRFAITFGIFAGLLYGMGALVVNLWQRVTAGATGGGLDIAPLLLLLLLLVPLAAGAMGRRAFRSIAAPIANVMAAADAVAQGDLSARVAEGGRGEFNQLARSFNHMVSQLQEEDQRRRNLTADVAHELRTPLQIIQGNLEGIADGVYAPTPEHLAATLDETRHLARLVDDLRVLSQAEAGQLAMQRERVNVAELVEDVATSFSMRAEEANIRLVTSLPGTTEPLVTLGDYGRLDQVLSNLIANALRHTPPGGQVTLSASTPADDAHDEPEPRMVLLQVSDTGEGMPAEALPYIFDRFYRADASRTRATGGSGLGLAIARQLVLAHGGRIEVTSQPGVGSAFSIFLPAADAGRDGASTAPA